VQQRHDALGRLGHLVEQLTKLLGLEPQELAVGVGHDGGVARPVIDE